MDHSPEAVRDVAEALHRVTCPGGSCTTVLSGHHLERARAALEAAAPHILATERKRIVSLMYQAFAALDPETRASLAAMMARWAAAMTDDPAVLNVIAGLLTEEPAD